MNKTQREWCRKYERETGFEPIMDDFKAGVETFDKAALWNIIWFESWSTDTLLRISKIPDNAREEE